MTGFIVRAYRAEDRPRLLGLLAALQNHERTIRLSRRAGNEMVEQALKDMAPTGKPGGPEIFVAEADGQIRGFISCFQFSNSREQDPKEYVIGNLYVDAVCRGRGVGRALVSHARQRAVDCGCARFVVGALMENEGALASYRKMGFKPAFMYLEQDLSQ